MGYLKSRNKPEKLMGVTMERRRAGCRNVNFVGVSGERSGAQKILDRLLDGFQ